MGLLRDPGPIVLGMLRDLGWTVCPPRRDFPLYKVAAPGRFGSLAEAIRWKGMAMRPHQRWRLLARMIVINFMFSGFSWTYIVMVVPAVSEEIGFPISEFGLLWGGISFGVLLASVPGGVLGDRFGVRRPIAGALVIGGLALLLRATADQFLMMLLTMVPFGIGLGIAAANVPKALGIWFPPKKLGLANGLALAGVSAGNALALLLTVPIVNRLGSWRTLTFILGAVLVVLALYWWLVVRDAAPQTPDARPTQRIWPSIAEVLRVREVWTLALCYFLFLGGLLGVLGYLPTFLTTVRGLSQESAAFVVSLAPWTFVIGSALLPALSDRVGLRRTVYSTAIAGSAVFLIGHAYLGGVGLALASAALGFSGGATGILFVVPVELRRVGPKLAGTAVGMIVSAGFLGGTLLPMVGMRQAETRPIATLAIFAFAFLLSALTFTLIRGTRSRNDVRAG
jgi:nitrate/nitrite transporter NarK